MNRIPFLASTNIHDYGRIRLLQTTGEVFRGNLHLLFRLVARQDGLGHFLNPEGPGSAHKPVLRSHRGESRSSNIRRYDSFERELVERQENAGAVRTSISRDRSYASHSQLTRLHYPLGKAKFDEDTLRMSALHKLLSLARVGAHFRA